MKFKLRKSTTLGDLKKNTVEQECAITPLLLLPFVHADLHSIGVYNNRCAVVHVWKFWVSSGKFGRSLGCNRKSDRETYLLKAKLCHAPDAARYIRFFLDVWAEVSYSFLQSSYDGTMVTCLLAELKSVWDDLGLERSQSSKLVPNGSARSKASKMNDTAALMVLTLGLIDTQLLRMLLMLSVILSLWNLS